MRIARSLASALVIAMALSPVRALADDLSPTQVAAARELFRSAMQDEDANRWNDALEKLKRVAGVKMTSGVRYHIALCEEHLGQLVAALNDYAAAEARARQENASDVMKLAPERLKAVRARVPHITILAPSDVSGVEVKLDGEPLLRELWGVAVPLDPGDHRVEASAPGRTPFDRTVHLDERDATLLELKLPPKTAAPPAGAVTPAPTSSSPPANAATPPAASSESTASPPGARAPRPSPSAAHSPSHTGAILATTGAVVLAAGGVLAFLQAGGAHDDGVTQCASRINTPCDDLKQSVQTWDALAAGAWIGATALGVVAVVLWTRSGDASSATVGVTSVGVAPGGLSLRGSF